MDEGRAKGPKREPVDRLGDALNFGFGEKVCDEISGDEVNSEVDGLEPKEADVPNDEEAPNVEVDAKGEVEVILEVAADRRP